MPGEVCGQHGLSLQGERGTDSALLASALLRLERASAHKRRLLRALTRAAARGPIAALAASAEGTLALWEESPLGRPELDPVWQEVAAANRALRGATPERLRRACTEWLPNPRIADRAAALLLDPHGILGCVAAEDAFLESRAACQRAFSPERAAAVARRTSDFAAALCAERKALRELMRTLRAAAPSQLEIRQYGFGEISRTIGLEGSPASPFGRPATRPAVVYKRLAPFPDAASAERYKAAYLEYNRRLRDEVGIAVPEFGCRALRRSDGRLVVYATQALVDPRSVAKELLLRASVEQAVILFRMVLAEYRKWIRYNREQAQFGFEIGLDGQIPNWALHRYEPGAELRGDEGLIYLDTNTPMMRHRGQDCLPIEFYLQATPRLLRPLLKPLARSILDRYFRPRTIVLDFLGNVSIHGRPDLVSPLLPLANAFLRDEVGDPDSPPIRPEEVRRYVGRDVATWRLTRSLRKIEDCVQGKSTPLATARDIYRIYTRPIF